MSLHKHVEHHVNNLQGCHECTPHLHTDKKHDNHLPARLTAHHGVQHLTGHLLDP